MGKEASQTRAFLRRKSATLRAAGPDSLRQAQGRLSRRKERLFGMTILISVARLAGGTICVLQCSGI
jgi:hypothetical protein